MFKVKKPSKCPQLSSIAILLFISTICESSLQSDEYMISPPEEVVKAQIDNRIVEHKKKLRRKKKNRNYLVTLDEEMPSEQDAEPDVDQLSTEIISQDDKEDLH